MWKASCLVHVKDLYTLAFLRPKAAFIILPHNPTVHRSAPLAGLRANLRAHFRRQAESILCYMYERI